MTKEVTYEHSWYTRLPGVLLIGVVAGVIGNYATGFLSSFPNLISKTISNYTFLVFKNTVIRDTSNYSGLLPIIIVVPIAIYFAMEAGNFLIKNKKAASIRNFFYTLLVYVIYLSYSIVTTNASLKYTEFKKTIICQEMSYDEKIKFSKRIIQLKTLEEVERTFDTKMCE